MKIMKMHFSDILLSRFYDLDIFITILFHLHDGGGA